MLIACLIVALIMTLDVKIYLFGFSRVGLIVEELFFGAG